MDKAETPSRARPYHHGDLKAALLRQAEQILERDGPSALTLRAVARAAGVSHAAPNNHFADLTGLLSELAAVGFNRFAAALEQAMQAGSAPASPGMGPMGTAYVGFARAHPRLFALMFRSERLDATRPALRDAIDAARQVLRSGVRAGAADHPLTPVQEAARAAAAWSLVHGFAMLLTEGRFDGLLRALPPGEDADSLLRETLAATTIG